MDIVTLFEKGGPVMWVLLGYSVVAVAIIVERLIHFGLMPKPGGEPRFGRIAPEDEIGSGLKQAVAMGIADLERIASRIGSEQLVRMESGLRTLAWLGNTAPLLGLFGTITGMIKAFMVIEAAGGKVDAQALAGGIWEAMVTTGAGLAVAIPILLLLHMIEGYVDRRAKLMQRAASELIESLPHQNSDKKHDAIRHQSSLSHAV